jgi:hypothetical protein
MYLIFVGITIQIDEVKKYLREVEHTLLEGTSVWNKLELNAQVVIMFNKDDALAFKGYLRNELHQLEVPVHFINSTQI